MISLLRRWALPLLISTLPAAAWAAELDLFVPEKGVSAPSALTQLGWAKRHAWIRLAPDAAAHLAAASTAPTDVRVQLFDDTTFVLQEQSRQITSQGSTTIRYALRNDPEGGAVLSATQGNLVGTITTGDHRVYRVMPGTEGIHRAEELDHSKFPDCATHSPESLALAQNTTSAAAASPAVSAPQADSGSQIKVLVAYTQSVLSALGNTSAVQSLIATAISETNSGYSTSGVNTALNLVHTVQVNYNESGGFDAALNAITGTSDGQMDEVHALRNTYAADLVVLLINNADYCGIAWLPSTVSTSNEGLGFSVTAYNCATGYYSFGHEIGHNMGARHDRYVDPTSTASPYAHGHGYTNTAARIRSIMAYNNACAGVGGCTRVNHWSASDRLYGGSTTIGDTNNRNNDALNASINTIANYRVSASTYTLSVSKTGGGSGTVTSSPAGINCGATCSASFNSGSNVTLTASANAGSTFVGWSGGGCAGNGTCVVTIDSAKSVTATFTLNTYTLSVSKTGGGSGTVTSSPAGINCGATCFANFSHGSSVTLTASASAGSTFVGWSGGGCAGNGTCVVTIDSAKSVTATFTLNTYTLSVSKTGGGSGTVTSSPAGINCGATCSAPFNSGTSVTMAAMADAGSAFAGWAGACSGTGTCVIAMDSAKSVTATFTSSNGSAASIVPILMLLLD